MPRQEGVRIKHRYNRNSVKLYDKASRQTGSGFAPFAADDRSLLQAISQGQFTINGFRNRDLQALLYPIPTTSEQESRRRSAAISRKLRLLRAHYLIRKVPSSYRYQLTPLGRQIITAILAAGHAPVKSFMAKAA
ncbi:MAG TPA: hypothetical protein VFW31_18730 [Candidatus Angelobacter sp.]|nr:hypothetical protein [Candidatus Angelobacter sp.]